MREAATVSGVVMLNAIQFVDKSAQNWYSENETARLVSAFRKGKDVWFTRRYFANCRKV